jgi:hypothetical protein
MAFLKRQRGRRPASASLGCAPLRAFAGPIAAFLALWALPAMAADVVAALDEAQLVKLPERVATIVVGNPLIADATLQPGGVLVVTGKGYGTTNVIVLDRSGTVLMEKSIEVKGPGPQAVVVYRGIERETYSCTPICERRITLGDSKPYFDVTLDQTGNRNGQALGTSAGAAPAK